MDKIELIYNNYDDVVEKFGEEKIKARFSSLLKNCSDFVAKRGTDEKLKINSYLLMHSVMDYFSDVARLKEYADIKYVNFFKVISYECYWILRRKPIQVLEEKNEELVYINEKFVLTLIMAFLTEKFPDNFEEKLSEKRREAFDGFVKSLYYFLKYRSVSAQNLEMILLSFCAGIVSATDEDLLPSNFF